MKIGLGVLLLSFSSLAYSVNRMIDEGDFPSGGSRTNALGIGMIHALPMLVVAFLTRSKLLTVLTGIGMVAIAVAIGGARYAILDLFFVALGTWGALRLCVPKGLSEFARAQLAAEAARTAEEPKRVETAKSILEDIGPMNDMEMKNYFEAMSDNQCNSFIYSFRIPGWLDPDSVTVKTATKGYAWWARVDYPTQSEAAWAILTMIRHATGHTHAEMSEEELLDFIDAFIRRWRQDNREAARA